MSIIQVVYMIDSIWVHGYNSLGPNVFAEMSFLLFYSLKTRKRKRCGQVGPSQCYIQSEVVYAYQVLSL